MNDSPSLFWLIATVIGPVSLGAAILYGMMMKRRSRSRTEDKAAPELERGPRPDRPDPDRR